MHFASHCTNPRQYSPSQGSFSVPQEHTLNLVFIYKDVWFLFLCRRLCFTVPWISVFPWVTWVWCDNITPHTSLCWKLLNIAHYSKSIKGTLLSFKVLLFPINYSEMLIVEPLWEAHFLRRYIGCSQDLFLLYPFINGLWYAVPLLFKLILIMDEKSWQITSSLVASSGGLAYAEFPGSNLLRASLVLILCCQWLLQGSSLLPRLDQPRALISTEFWWAAARNYMKFP